MGDENYDLNFDDSNENFIVEFGEVTQIGGGGTSDFNELTNRPSYNGQVMTGSTDIPEVPTATSDLTNDSDYQTGTEVQSAISSAIAGKQDTLTAGDNITIQNNVISATDTTYTAGDGIDITGNVISADIKPADYFTASETVDGTGSALTLNGTIEAKLDGIELLGDTEQDGTPTPSSPVDVDVVAGTQTVRVLGKNLWNMTAITGSSASLTITGPDTEGGYELHWTGGFDAILSDVTGLNNATTYTISFKHKGEALNLREVGQSTSMISTNADTGYVAYHYTFTGKDSLRLEFIRKSSTTNVSAFVKDFQVEVGSTATTYQPYQSQSYTVNLGSTELCKIGTYQDYIYKSGDDWYVHKAVGKSILGDLTWIHSNTTETNVYRMQSDDLSGLFVPPSTIYDIIEGACNYFITSQDSSNGTYGAHTGISAHPTSGAIHIYNPDYNTSSSESAFTTWLQNNNVIFYYALATPTDTKITDNTLIGHLDTLAAANSYDPQTNFITTATGTNLPVILDVKAYRKSLDGTLGAIAGFTDHDTTYTAGTNIQISSSNVISATDTTYSAFIGTDGNTAGTSGLVPAPATTDAGKFLKADGTWAAAGGGGGSLVHTLTTDDYNWNFDLQSQTEPYDSIALWLMPSGIYYVDNADGSLQVFNDIEGNAIFCSPSENGAIITIQNYSADGGSVDITTYTPTTVNGGVAFESVAVDGSTGSPFNGTYPDSSYYVPKYGMDSYYVPTLRSTDDPNNEGTIGYVGDLCVDTTNSKFYVCDSRDDTDPDAPVCTWTEIGGGGGPTVVQTPGSSQTDVMSQNATSSMVFADPDTQTKIKIGAHTSTSEGNNAIEIGNYSQATQSGAIAIGGGNSAINSAFSAALGAIAIGGGSTVSGQRSISIGQGSRVDSSYGVSLGSYATVATNCNGSVALGAGTTVGGNTVGLIQVGVNNPGFSDPTSYGYNNTIYRLIRGLYDGEDLHDAATVAQGNTLATSAPTTSTVGVLGQLYTDTTNMHTYQCTDITGGVYTWTQRW